jgi:hypothetical protein
MYEKLSDGIFFEVGGTSMDISCVKDGKVMIKYAEVGGHKTDLSSLDVRTVGIGGGSMVELRDGKAVDAGPRSVHIAGLAYDELYRQEAASKILGFSAQKNSKVVLQLMKDYGIARNALVISTIGVALAMVRDMVERIIVDPSNEDIIAIRREAERKALTNEAAPGTVEVSVQVDTQRNLVRAIAVGATEMRSRNLLDRRLSKQEILAVAADNLNVPEAELFVSAENGSMFALQYERTEKKLFGMLKKRTTPLRLVDEEGIIRLQKNNALVLGARAGEKTAANLILSHEFFHFLECTGLGLTSRMYQVPMIVIGPLKIGRTGIRALSEIGAHGFARTYYDLLREKDGPEETQRSAEKHNGEIQ